jgi:putative transposase
MEQRDVNAAKVILNRANATEGHSGSNASGDVPSTSMGRKSSKSKEHQ